MFNINRSNVVACEVRFGAFSGLRPWGVEVLRQVDMLIFLGRRYGPAFLP